MFQFPEFPPHELCIHSWVTGLLPAGFPHSDIKGSMPAYGSPLLFAVSHVLLRRLVPWHPPCALVRLITDPETSLQFFRFLIELLATGLLRLLFSSFMCGCQGARAISRPRIPQNPENDTELRRQFLLRTVRFALCPSFALTGCLFYASLPWRNRPRFEASAFTLACSLERR